jgi:hypothetical protein
MKIISAFLCFSPEKEQERTCQEFDGEVMTNIPQTRYSHLKGCMALFNGNVAALGGGSLLDDPNQYGKVEMYEDQMRTWQKIPSLPNNPRFFFKSTKI